MHKKISFANTENEYWDDISQEAKEFILLCLDRNPSTRSSIKELFQSKWIQNYFKDQEGKAVTQDQEIQQSIQKNLIKFGELNQFQKLVLSLVAGLSASKEELEQMQQEFLRLDVNKTGTLTLADLKKITESELGRKYANLEHDHWQEIFQECDLNNDGVIDFQDFISVCVDRKALVKNEEIWKAFKIIDTNRDGQLSRSDF